MSIIKNIAAFKNWSLLYAGRYGFLRHEFEMIHRSGIRIKLLPNTHFEMVVSGSSGYQDICAYVGGSTGSHSLYKQDTNHMVKKRVRTISLEGVIEREDLSRIDFLKLDGEGAEHDIFRKMSFDTAAQIGSIAMEAHRVPREFSIDIPARLKDLGFEIRTEHNGGYVYAMRNKPYPST